MTDLQRIQEISFLVAQLSNTVNDKTRLAKRDHAAQLYIAASNLVDTSLPRECCYDARDFLDREIKRIELIDLNLRELC